MGGPHDIREAVDSLPLGPVREALHGMRAWVVGGVVRDLQRGVAPPTDVDIAVDGDLEPVLERLSAETAVEAGAHHERFGTATVRCDGLTIDLARTRSERYAAPGALPDVEPAGIEADLARRDFTVNAMAMPLASGDLLDPYGGAADLSAGVLRVLHDASFTDDPTRALRAARYASRLGLEPDERTRDLLAGVDLSTVSADRRRAELARLAEEPSAAAGFRLLADWGLITLSDDSIGLIAAIEGHSDPAVRSQAIMLVVEGGSEGAAALELARARPEQPSEAVRLAARRSPAQLLVAEAAGAGWVADYRSSWRDVALEITGEDLLAAGVPEGPAVGAGLRGALARKLDGELEGGREAELATAVELARGSI